MGYYLPVRDGKEALAYTKIIYGIEKIGLALSVISVQNIDF
jgi:hypothetical protein